MMNQKGTVAIETERLILRRFSIDDAEAMFRNWASDDEVTKFLTWPTHTDVSVSKAVINSWVELYQKPSHYSWAIVLKEIGEHIGSTAVVKQDVDMNMVHIGYCIGRNWWHKGYTSEALNRLVEFFFEEVGVHRIESRHDPRNPNSGKVMQKAGLQFEGIMRKSDQNNQGGYCDAAYYAILAEDYFAGKDKPSAPPSSNIATLKTSTELMFHNLHIAMDTVDWNADICDAPAWRYIYHTLHSADKFFINPSSWVEKDEPPFHSHMLDWPDTPTDTVLSKETLHAYFDKVRQKIVGYIDNLNDIQLSERPGGKLTRLGLMLSQFRHMYAHIGILNGVTIVNTQQFPRVITEGAWRSGILPEGLYDVEERK